jgi:hypothetical protein
LVEKFQSIGAKTQRVIKLLEEDSKQIVGPANNLLLVHFELQNLLNFRDTILATARGASADVLNTLNQLFKKLEQLEYNFEIYFWELARNTWPLVKGGFSSTVVRLVKIIEVTEKNDSLITLRHIGSGQDTERLETLQPTKVKGYRIKYFDVLREGIIVDIQKMVADNVGDLDLVLDAFNSVIDTLTIVHDELIPLYPKSYNILNFFVLEYHRGIYNTIQALTNSEFDPASTLGLIKWIHDYYTNMNLKFEVSEDMLEPKLLDGREQEFMDAYVRLVRSKLSEWLHNILNSETVEFLDRKIPPESDKSGQYIMTGSVIAFQMFNQQLDVVSVSAGNLISDIVTECCNAMVTFQSEWTKMIDMEFSKFRNKSTDLNEGLVEYTTALCNDCLRSQEFAEEIVSRLESLQSKDLKLEQSIANVILY